MNTLSKYDIADIVSHISGKAQSADAQSPEGHSFADLLREAVKNIPDSNVEGKAAESGKTRPESPLNDERVKTPVSAESAVEPELQMLLRQVFSQVRGESVIDARASSLNDSDRQQSELGYEEKSELIANLRAALKFRGQKDIEIPGEAFITNDTNSLATKAEVSKDDSESIDDQIRIATLKQRRPVILGPGSDDEKLRSQFFANPYKEDSFFRSGPQNVPDSLKSEGTSGQNIFDSPVDSNKQAQKVDRLAEAQQQNFTNRSVGVSDADVNITLKDQTLREDDAGKASVLNDKVKKDLGNIENAGVKGFVLSDKQESLEIAKPLQESRHQIKRSEKTAKYQETSDFVARDQIPREDSSQFLGVRVKNSERLQDKSKSDDRNSSEVFDRYSITETELKSPNEDSLGRKFQVDHNLSVRKTNPSLGDEQRVVEFKSSDFDPQEFDPKAGAYIKDSNQLRSIPVQKNFESKDRRPEVGIEVSNQLISGIKRKESEAKFSKGSATGNFDLSENSTRESSLKAEFEVRINEPAKKHLDQIRPSALDPNLTVEESDPSINNQKGESTESLKSEPFVSLQSERTVGLSRSEVAQRTTVSVSNFSSEMQETIMGQLSKTATGTSKFTVALFPENLGKISIEISYSDLAGLKITMIGDNPEATKILEQNLPTLRENLQTDKLNELLVNLNNNKDSNGSNQKHSQSEGDNFASREDKETGKFEFADSNSRTQNEVSNDSETGLDTYV